MITLDVERPAHGGHCVARHEGRVVFVRHALPGETVRAHVTGEGPQGRYWFADAVEIVSAAPGRRPPPCPWAGPGRCGGCDWQHAEPETQRVLKAQVLAEQLARLGGVDVPVDVRAVPGDAAGLDWRTRVRYAVATDGRLGFRRHGKHTVQAVGECAIAAPAVRAAADPAADWRPAREVLVVAGDDATHVLPVPAGEPAPEVRHAAAGRSWLVPADGFWQVHPGAADALVAAVAPAVAGAEVLWDLYCGVGLFAGAVGADCRRVDAVESSRAAVARARDNLADLPHVAVHRVDVARWLGTRVARRSRPAAVVLDPPRTGAGRAVIEALTASTATTLAYVACDPASLGRDVGTLRRAGWELVSVTGLDLFPNTAHVEAVAVLRR